MFSNPFKQVAKSPSLAHLFQRASTPSATHTGRLTGLRRAAHPNSQPSRVQSHTQPNGALRQPNLTKTKQYQYTEAPRGWLKKRRPPIPLYNDKHAIKS